MMNRSKLLDKLPKVRFGENALEGRRGARIYRDLLRNCSKINLKLWSIVGTAFVPTLSNQAQLIFNLLEAHLYLPNLSLHTTISTNLTYSNYDDFGDSNP